MSDYFQFFNLKTLFSPILFVILHLHLPLAAGMSSEGDGGRKLEDVLDDVDVYNLVWRTMILEDIASNPSDIISTCHLNFDFQERYPGMQHRDWDKIVMSFIHDVQMCYDLEITEIFNTAV